MRKTLPLLLLCAALALLPGCGQKQADAPKVDANGKKTVSLLLREESKYTSDVMARAIDALNKSGRLDATITYKLLPKTDEDTELIQFKAGNYTDFRWNTNSDIGWMSEMGMIQPVDWVKDLSSFQTVPDNIMQNITYNGHIWAVPNRTAVTALYTNKQALAALGWSDADVAALPGKIERGEFTMDDMMALATQAVQKGTVKYGLMMDEGVEWHSLTAMASTFGAVYYDSGENKLILDKAKWMNYFTWWQNAMKNNIVQKSQVNMSKETVDRILTDHEALFLIGHGGYKNLLDSTGMDRQKFGDWFFGNFLMSKIPSSQKGSPGTSMMKLYVMFVSSKTGQDKMPYVQDIVNYIFSDESGLEAQANYNEVTMPVTQALWQNAQIKADPFLTAATAYVKGSTTWPTDPYFPYYLIAHRKVVEKMVVDGITAQQAYDMLREELTYNVDSKALVVKE